MFCVEVKGWSSLEPRRERCGASSSRSWCRLSQEQTHCWVRPPTQPGQIRKAPWEGVICFGFCFLLPFSLPGAPSRKSLPQPLGRWALIEWKMTGTFILLSQACALLAVVPCGLLAASCEGSLCIAIFNDIWKRFSSPLAPTSHP